MISEEELNEAIKKAEKIKKFYVLINIYTQDGHGDGVNPRLILGPIQIDDEEGGTYEYQLNHFVDNYLLEKGFIHEGYKYHFRNIEVDTTEENQIKEPILCILRGGKRVR